MEYRLQITEERMREVRLIIGSDSCGKMSAAECREVHHKEKLGGGRGSGSGGRVKKMGERKGKRNVVRRVRRKIEIQMKGVNVKMRCFKESSGNEDGGRSWMNSRI